LNTFVIQSDHQWDVTSCGNGAVFAECDKSISDEIEHLPRPSSAAADNCLEELDLDDSSCIPDTQFIQSAHHLSCLPSAAFSPDSEMIPDTPDSASGTGVRKSFHRSYLASTANLLAGCDSFPRKKISPPRRKITKGKSQLRKHTHASTNNAEECSVSDGISSQLNFSPSIIQPVAVAAQVPYPSCDILPKRCATDPFPMSKRCNHKVTPTKPTKSDAVYGTVPCQLFQEALKREKCQQISNSRMNKENARPVEEVRESLDLDSDPMLLEVLGELKVDSQKMESEPSVSIAVGPIATNNTVCNDVSNFCDKTEAKLWGISNGDDDLEDILGELRQQNIIQNSIQQTPSNDAMKNRSSLSPNVVKENLSTSVPACLSAVIVLDDRNPMFDQLATCQKATVDFRPTDPILEEWTDISAKESIEAHMKSVSSEAVDDAVVNGMSSSCMQSTCDGISDSKVDREMCSANFDQNARYVVNSTQLNFIVTYLQLAKYSSVAYTIHVA